MKKKIMLILVCCLALAAFAACSQNNGTAQSTQSTGNQTTAENQGDIGQDRALEIALEHAGVAEADISHQRVKLDYDDGISQYEVEFYVGNQEYDYDIDAATGEIRSFDSEIEDDFWQNGSTNNNTGAAIAEADAIAIVLERVPGATESDVRIHFERDDGRDIYEGELIYNQIKYEFEIDAATGDVLQWEEER